jgi:hypothetical protein
MLQQMHPFQQEAANITRILTNSGWQIRLLYWAAVCIDLKRRINKMPKSPKGIIIRISPEGNSVLHKVETARCNVAFEKL